MIDITSQDIQGALRSRNPVMVGLVPVLHIPFSKITSPEIGYADYNKMVSIFCIDIEQHRDKLKNDGEGITPLRLLCATALSDDNFRSLFNRSCCLFFGSSPVVDESCNLLFYSHSKVMCPTCRSVYDKTDAESRVCKSCGKRTEKFPLFKITDENFDDIARVIKVRNGAMQKGDDNGNPAGEKARQIIARRNEIRRKRASAFKEKNGLTFWELIDIYASMLGVTYQEAMEMDIYQLKIQLERLKLTDDYKVGIESLLHGAKKSDVNLKHWLRKIEQNDDDNEEDEE